MSTSVYVCPTCKQRLEIDKEYLGVKVECPTCGHPFIVHHAFLAKDYDHSPSLSAAPQSFETPKTSPKKEKTLEQKLNDLGNCDLGLACVCLAFNIIFGIWAIIYSTQALSFVRIKDWDRASDLAEVSRILSVIGIILGIVFWIIMIFGKNIR